MARRGKSRLALASALLLGCCLAPAAWLPAEDFAQARRKMVEEQVRSRGVTDARVLAAMEAVPRHLFVPDGERVRAYTDSPLPIGAGQTISQPYIVALMTSLLDVQPGDRILEVGTGSGYQAAVLSRLARQVYSIEIIEHLANRARRTLETVGYNNVEVLVGDGYKGWPEEAPFDGIIVTAAPPRIPEPLLRQLKTGGKLVIPVGEGYQDLEVLTKRADGDFDRTKVLPVRFVPMTGQVQRERP
ncbi:MAG TPA: protein-L-isoaspartate(D-aspartate) O-methyltransferase [Thermoanaerobaculia bacterium]